MALEQVPFSHRRRRTDAFRALDPTEKGSVSFFLGMAICKLFANVLLSTPWLPHLDVFRDQLNPTILGGRSRPELVGEDASGAWHAFETKGRSRAPGSEDKRNAKAQAQRLVSVDGAPCSPHIESFAFFRRNELEFHWRDPKTEEPEKLEPIGISVVEEDWANYCAPALPLSSELGREFLTARAQEIDVKVDIHPEVLAPLLEGRWAAARSVVNELRQSLKASGFQPDGLRVVAGASWQSGYKCPEG